MWGPRLVTPSDADDTGRPMTSADNAHRAMLFPLAELWPGNSDTSPPTPPHPPQPDPLTQCNIRVGLTSAALRGRSKTQRPVPTTTITTRPRKLETLLKKNSCDYCSIKSTPTPHVSARTLSSVQQPPSSSRDSSLLLPGPRLSVRGRRPNPL